MKKKHRKIFLDPKQTVRGNKLFDLSPQAWKLSPCDTTGSIFIDYYHDGTVDIIEMAAFQVKHNQFNVIARQLNDESDLQNKTGFEQESY